jgi:hypothetical protein
MLNKAVLLALALCMMALVGCRNNSAQGTIEHSQVISTVDWADFIKINGHTYTRSKNGALTDPAQLGASVGTISFNVADHVHDSQYAIKDGDAAFLAAGTSVYSIGGYANDEIVAVKDDKAFNGYGLYIDDQHKSEVSMSLDSINESQVIKASIEQDSPEHPLIVELEGGSAKFFTGLLNRNETADTFRPDKENANPMKYRFILSSGAAVGLIDYIYYDGNRYYRNKPNPTALPAAMGYYLAKEKDVVFRSQGMEFTLPNSSVTLATGEKIKRDGSTDNITLIAANNTERKLFPANAFNTLLTRVQKENPGDGGEAKTLLYWASRPLSVSNGTAIAFESNKETVLQKKQYFNIDLIKSYGTGERILVNGAIYGNVMLLDSVGDRIIAQTQDYALLDINMAENKIKKIPINGDLIALSKEGRYVLYHDMLSDSQVGSKLLAYDLQTEHIISLGETPKDFIYNQGVK